jgi:hypothetical protein
MEDTIEETDCKKSPLMSINKFYICMNKEYEILLK